MARNQDSATFEDLQFDQEQQNMENMQQEQVRDRSSFADSRVLPSRRESTTPSGSRSKRRKLICFACNRMEGHFLVAGRRWFFSFLLGLSFGLVLVFGPYRCQCCGTDRWMAFDSLNLRYWFRQFRHGEFASPRRNSRRRSEAKSKS